MTAQNQKLPGDLGGKMMELENLCISVDTTSDNESIYIARESLYCVVGLENNISNKLNISTNHKKNSQEATGIDVRSNGDACVTRKDKKNKKGYPSIGSIENQ